MLAFTNTEVTKAELAHRDTVIAELLEALEELKQCVCDLVADSDGVAGLHLNGDLAHWHELMPGGMYEEWLLPVEKARKAIAKAKGEK